MLTNETRGLNNLSKFNASIEKLTACEKQNLQAGATTMMSQILFAEFVKELVGPFPMNLTRYF